MGRGPVTAPALGEGGRQLHWFLQPHTTGASGRDGSSKSPALLRVPAQASAPTWLTAFTPEKEHTASSFAPSTLVSPVRIML